MSKQETIVRLTADDLKMRPNLNDGPRTSAARLNQAIQAKLHEKERQKELEEKRKTKRKIAVASAAAGVVLALTQAASPFIHGSEFEVPSAYAQGGDSGPENPLSSLYQQVKFKIETIQHKNPLSDKEQEMGQALAEKVGDDLAGSAIIGDIAEQETGTVQGNAGIEALKEIFKTDDPQFVNPLVDSLERDQYSAEATGRDFQKSGEFNVFTGDKDKPLNKNQVDAMPKGTILVFDTQAQDDTDPSETVLFVSEGLKQDEEERFYTNGTRISAADLMDRYGAPKYIVVPKVGSIKKGNNGIIPSVNIPELALQVPQINLDPEKAKQDAGETLSVALGTAKEVVHPVSQILALANPKEKQENPIPDAKIIAQVKTPVKPVETPITLPDKSRSLAKSTPVEPAPSDLQGQVTSEKNNGQGKSLLEIAAVKKPVLPTPLIVDQVVSQPSLAFVGSQEETGGPGSDGESAGEHGKLAQVLSSETPVLASPTVSDQQDGDTGNEDPLQSAIATLTSKKPVLPTSLPAAPVVITSLESQVTPTAIQQEVATPTQDTGHGIVQAVTPASTVLVTPTAKATVSLDTPTPVPGGSIPSPVIPTSTPVEATNTPILIQSPTSTPEPATPTAIATVALTPIETPAAIPTQKVDSTSTPTAKPTSTETPTSEVLDTNSYEYFKNHREELIKQFLYEFKGVSNNYTDYYPDHQYELDFMDSVYRLAVKVKNIWKTKGVDADTFQITKALLSVVGSESHFKPDAGWDCVGLFQLCRSAKEGRDKIKNMPPIEQVDGPGGDYTTQKANISKDVLPQRMLTFDEILTAIGTGEISPGGIGADYFHFVVVEEGDSAWDNNKSMDEQSTIPGIRQNGKVETAEYLDALRKRILSRYGVEYTIPSVFWKNRNN